MDVMVPVVNIGFLVVMFTSGTIFANIPMGTFATMATKFTGVPWLLGLIKGANNVPLVTEKYFQLSSNYVNVVGCYIYQGQFNNNDQL
jgi:hypothetical protein